MKVKALTCGVAALIFSSTASAGRPAAASAPAACRLSQFVVALGPYVSEEGQQHTLALRLINRAPRSCVLYGYPHVALDDETGAIPFPIRDGGDEMISARQPRRVVVRADGAAFVVLNKSACVRGVLPGSRAATRLRIRAPRGPSAEVASLVFPKQMPFRWRVPDYCGKGDPVSIITVSPFAQTTRAALGF